MSQSKRMQYEAVVKMDVTAHDGTTQLHSVELEYDHQLPVDHWIDTKTGKFTERGINALLLAFCSGVTSIIHAAGQQNGMDTAALFRKAIAIQETQFVSQVTAVPTKKPKSNGHPLSRT